MPHCLSFLVGSQTARTRAEIDAGRLAFAEVASPEGVAAEAAMGQHARWYGATLLLDEPRLAAALAGTGLELRETMVRLAAGPGRTVHI